MMNKIFKMSTHLKNQIAAGEVITEPLSVVKELIDNSVDALATEIVVEIENYGLKSIKVYDNGVGIPKESIDLLFYRHATSKLKSENDLFNITTLGFRGEALASIVSVSKVEVISRTKESLQGFRLKKYANNVLVKEFISTNIGTTVIVNDLFFNTPARFSFLKKNNILLKNISDYISKVAVNNSNIRFKYVVDDKVIFITNGNGDYINSIYNIYGDDFINSLKKFNYSNKDLSIHGYMSDLSYSKTNRNFQYFFINNRVTNNSNLSHAIRDAYVTLLPNRRYPVIFWWVNSDYKNIDINIHPQKEVVKFKSEIDFSLITEKIREELLKKDIVPKLVKKEISYSNEEEQSIDFSQIKYLDIVQKQKDVIDFIKEDSIKENNLEDLEFISRLFSRYLLFKSDKDLYIIDHFYAHHKILYEEYLKDYTNNEILSKILINPFNITLYKKDILFIDKKIEKLNLIGFEVDLFENSLIIREIPNSFSIDNAELFIKEFIETDSFDDDINENLIIKRALRNSVCEKVRLKDEEILTLFNKLKTLKDPYTSPNNKPIIIKLTKEEIDRRFLR